MKRPSAAYTLVEVLVAASILLIAAAAAAALALATLAQEEANARVARCTNLNEQAARLYQLGLAPDTITALLPPDPAVVSLTFETQDVFIENLGTVQRADSTLVYTTAPLAGDWSPGTWTAGQDSAETLRTSQVTAFRPSIR